MLNKALRSRRAALKKDRQSSVGNEARTGKRHMERADHVGVEEGTTHPAFAHRTHRRWARDTVASVQKRRVSIPDHETSVVIAAHTRRTLFSLFFAVFVLFSLSGVSSAAGIKVVPSASQVMPGDTFYADIVVEDIPSKGLGAIQFRLNMSAAGSSVAAVSDTSQGQPGNISVSSPLVVGPATTGSSGLGDFFWNAKSSHGILVMENEALENGSGMYTLGHTYGAALPSGSGSIARFLVKAGSEAAAEKIVISLSDVTLLESSTVYPVESNIGATIDLKCYTQVPNLVGMSNINATAALSAAKLTLGSVYEIDNAAGTHALNTVLVQSASPGTTALCETPIDLAVNTAPNEASNVQAADKAGEESGTLVFSWIPSSSSDAAGYRVYNASGITLTDIAGASASSVEISGLANGVSQQFRVTAYDTFGNESAGVNIAAAAVDDLFPRIFVSGVIHNAYYPSDVHPVITVQDANLAAQDITLNGAAYNQHPISGEGTYHLAITATDASGNTSIEEVRFVVDKTPPVITVTGIEKNRFYNTDLSPAVSVADANLENVESSLNGSAYTNGTVLILENNYQLVILAMDKAGNISNDTYLFHIDKTRPASAISIGVPRLEDEAVLYVAGSTPFTLAGNDPGAVQSGVDRLEFRANSEMWSAYHLPVTLTGLNDGAMSIDYRAIDRATNIEDFQTLAVTLDNTSPMTTVTTADPKYSAADGNIYVTIGTVFTLAAVDNLSGVASTDYRIDNGQWTAYAPFTISAEGMHMIDYYSKDKVANMETFKTLAVIVDDSPPVSTAAVGTPHYQADGKLYVAASTNITITAEDAASGAKRSEFSIDGGDWNIYTAAFTLASHTNGSHTIRYRSMDNVNNIEEAKELVVILERTPPVTTISASDPLIDGLINSVSPSTFFTLTAEDALSGVKYMAYRINNGPWQGYTGSFSLAGMSAGQHTIAYRAMDNVLNEEAEKTITVRLIVIEVEKKIAADSNVLIGVESDKSEYAQRQIDVQRLAVILSSINVDYMIAETMEDFTTALRSGRYNTYVLIDVKDPLIGAEVREAVHYGDSLIFIKTKPTADPFLDDVFGVKFSGKTTSDDLVVDLLSSPISSEGTFQTTGKSVVSSIATEKTEVFGSVADKRNTYPSIIFNQYERGKALLYTFDLLNAADRTLASALLIESLNFTRPAAQTPMALGRIPIRIAVKNAAEPVEVRVRESLPQGATVDNVLPRVTLIDNTLTWQKSLAAEELTRFGYYMNLPDMEGNYLTKTDVVYNNNGLLRPYGEYELMLTVMVGSADLLDKIIADIRSMSLDKTADIDHVTAAIDHLLLVDVNAASRKKSEDNIRHILKAIDELRQASIDISAVRIQLGRLLKIIEKKWYLME